jgi:hypothetical protein
MFSENPRAFRKESGDGHENHFATKIGIYHATFLVPKSLAICKKKHSKNISAFVCCTAFKLQIVTDVVFYKLCNRLCEQHNKCRRK